MPDEIKRRAVEPLDRAERGVDERLMLAAPWLGRRLVSATVRAPAGSRLRRAALPRLIRTGLAAINRRDYVAMSAFFAPGVELCIYPDEPGSRATDMDPVYRLAVFYVWQLERGLLRRNWVLASEEAMLAMLESPYGAPIASMPREP